MENKKHNNPKSFLRKAKEIPGNPEFLTSLRTNLLQYMEMNPEREVHKSSFVRTPFFSIFMPVFAAFVLIFIIGGTSFASQGSLPGDLLYPVKILSERINVATSFTPEARVKAGLSIARERVNEVSALALKNLNENLNDSDDNEQFHANMKSAISNFNAQVSKTLNEENNLREKKEIERSSKIAEDIKQATNSFNNILQNAKEKSGNRDLEDVDQLIDSNNDFNTRVMSESKSDNSKESRNYIPKAPTDKPREEESRQEEQSKEETNIKKNDKKPEDVIVDPQDAQENRNVIEQERKSDSGEDASSSNKNSSDNNNSGKENAQKDEKDR